MQTVQKLLSNQEKAETDMCPSVVKICAERWSGRWRWRKRRRCHFLSRRGNQYACRLSAQTKIRSRTGRRRWQEELPWKNGADLILKVPEGTIIRDAASGKVIADMSGENKRSVILHGGRGGLGNQHFATSTMQAPKYAQPGQEAIEIEVQLELKVIADVGLVGFPNVGKSTFLSRVTNAQPKIANYHFTTLQPNLGVVDMEDGNGFVIADIPGLIEGASDGVGLGHEFLRHIERTKVIIHIVDAAGTEGRDPIADIHAINRELDAYNPDLLKKPQVIAANKIDAIYGNENEIISALRAEFEEKEGIKVYPISAVSGQGVRELLFHVRELLAKCPKEAVVYEQEFDPALGFFKDEPYTITRAEDGAFVVEGPKIEKCLDIQTWIPKRILFFQKFLREQGILKELEEQGIQDGDTVRMYYNEFDYYK